MSSQLPVPSKAALTALRGVILGTSCGIALIAEDRRRRINKALTVIENGQKIKSARGYRSGGDVQIAQRERDVLFETTDYYLQHRDEHVDHPRPANRRLSTSLYDEAIESAPLHRLGQEERLDHGALRAVMGADTSIPPQQPDANSPAISTRGTSERSLTAMGVDMEGAEGSIKRDGLLDNEALKTMLQQDSTRTTKQGSPRTVESKYQSIADRLARRSPAHPKQKPEPFIPPLLKPPISQHGAGIWPSARPFSGKQRVSTEQDNEAIMSALQDACRDREPKALADAVQSSQGAFKHTKSWIETYALLCRTYVEMGRVGEAVDILNFVTRGQGMSSTGSFADSVALFEPLTLAGLSLAEAGPHSCQTPEYLGHVRAALRCYLAVPKEMQSDRRFFTVGRTLLFAMIEVNMIQKVRIVFRRATEHLEDDPDGFTAQFLAKLQEKHHYRLAIATFLDFYPRLSPAKESIRFIGDTLVQCVEGAHNWKPADVLKTLLRLLPGDFKIKTEWVARLLRADWARHRNFDKTEGLFRSLTDPNVKKGPKPGEGGNPEEGAQPKARANLGDVVLHPDCVYRIMIESALEAGEPLKAEKYLLDAAAYKPDIAYDVQLLGIFAQDCAKRGDWPEVRRLFEAMKVDGPTSVTAYGRVFVPVVKIYAGEHSTRECETYVRSYLDELKVPLSAYLVTLMAKQYALIRDFSAVSEWLQYCSRGGFPVDAAFTNAILAACKREGNMPFRDLRTLFRKLRALGPQFVDAHTERMMANAALTDSQLRGKFAANRLSSLRVTPNARPVKGLCAKDHDVVLSMQEGLVTHHPGRTIRVYKQAMRLGMPPSRRALHLAVQAAWDMPAEGRDARVSDLLKQARRYGQDINYVTNHIISLRLKEMESEGDRQDKYRKVKHTLELFESKGVTLADISFNRAANICLKARHLSGAVTFALRAAEVGGGTGPAYNIHNFRILLSVYVELVDVERIREVVARAVGSDYAEKTGCLATLKNAGRRVLKVEIPGVTEERRREAWAVIKDGVKKIVEARERLRANVEEMQGKAVEIMRKAAVDAGCPPVDFGSIPWLGGGKEEVKHELEVADHDVGFDQYLMRLESGDPEHPRPGISAGAG